jgi:hypothetical protein
MLLSAMPPAGIALLAPSKASASCTNDPVIGLLRQHTVSLENDTNDWEKIERDVSSCPPKVSTREGALECLRVALRIDNMGSFETALVSSALAYFQQ